VAINLLPSSLALLELLFSRRCCFCRAEGEVRAANAPNLFSALLAGYRCLWSRCEWSARKTRELLDFRSLSVRSRHCLPAGSALSTRLCRNRVTTAVDHMLCGRARANVRLQFVEARQSWLWVCCATTSFSW